MERNQTEPGGIRKVATGIQGFDDLTGGGVPGGRATLLVGEAGAGKTIFALHCLVHGARELGEPGIFVAFEEQRTELIRNAHNFGWNLLELVESELLFLDARPPAETFQVGNIDLSGLLAVINARVEAMNATRIVFDGLDVYLDMLPTHIERRREMHRLHDWMTNAGLTVFVTAKQDTGQPEIDPRISFMQFMVDCVIQFSHRLENRVSQRTLRVLRYRGSRFYENEASLIIGRRGMEVAGLTYEDLDVHASQERVSSGVADLDEMLDGGYLRNTVVLISGVPGTAKSTLAAAFAQAACLRGERAVMISFDEFPAEITRNSASVDIDLESLVVQGNLQIFSLQREVRSAEAHLLAIRGMIEDI